MGRITLCTTGIEVVSQEDEYPSLLAELESHQISMEYQCREGYCGSCRVRLLSGDVEWLTTPLAFIKHDEILPCCCRAKGDIEIDI